jgi:site-specific recombinase XerD
MLQEMIEKYLETSKEEKAEHTYRGEYTIAQSLMRCLDSIGVHRVDQLKFDTQKDIIRYYRNFTKCKNSSINKHTAYLKAVLRSSGFHDHPFLLTKKLRDDTEHTKVIEKKDLFKIMQYVMDLNKNKNSIVYRAVIFLLYETGSRINELLNIKIRNVNTHERWILLDTTKSHKDRVVPYSHLSAMVIEDLIKCNPQKEYLFWNLIKKRQLQYNDVKLFLRDMMEDIDIKHVHPHMFRKTMATALVEKGANTKTAQKILGHESIVTTEIYTEYNLRIAMKDYQRHDISTGVLSAIENRQGDTSITHFVKKRA